MVSISDCMGPHDKKKRVLKRQFNILNCIQVTTWNAGSNYNYPIQLELQFHWQGSGREVDCVGVTAEQLLDYRLFQRAVLEQTSFLIVDDDEFELGDVGLWPLRLASLLGEVA